MKDELVSRISKIVLISVMIILVLIVTFNQNPIDELPIMYETSDFTLPSTTGNSYSFSQDAGKVRIVTFTYTKCTVECPQLMDKLDQLNRELKRKSYYEKITFITIDFDYIQDTMNDLSEFQQSLTLDNDNWVFLLGNENQTKQVVQDWNYTFLIDPEHNDTSIPDGIQYIHEKIVYIVDGDGGLRKLYNNIDWEVNEAKDIVDFLIHETK